MANASSYNPFNYKFGEIRKAASAAGAVIAATVGTYISNHDASVLWGGVILALVTFLVTFLVPQKTLVDATDPTNDVPLNTWQPSLSLGLLDPTDEESAGVDSAPLPFDESAAVTDTTPDPFADLPPQS